MHELRGGDKAQWHSLSVETNKIHEILELNYRSLAFGGRGSVVPKTENTTLGRRAIAFLV